MLTCMLAYSDPDDCQPLTIFSSIAVLSPAVTGPTNAKQNKFLYATSVLASCKQFKNASDYEHTENNVYIQMKRKFDEV